MRFCDRMFLARTRRVLVETQRGIEMRAMRRRPRHRFTAQQLAVAARWAASQEKKAR